MISELILPFASLCLGVLLSFALEPWLIKVENTYRSDMDLPIITWRTRWPSLMTSSVMLILIGWLAKERLPEIALPTFGLVAASLRGVWRIDGATLLIPDRLHGLGSIAAILYVLALLVTGESWEALCFEIGFALSLVLLLWILSYLYFRIRGGVGFGFGDIKLLTWLSAFAGKRMPELIFIAIALGFVYLIYKTTKTSWSTRKLALPGAQEAFAFGPAIAIAVFIESFFHYV